MGLFVYGSWWVANDAYLRQHLPPLEHQNQNMPPHEKVGAIQNYGHGGRATEQNMKTIILDNLIEHPSEWLLMAATVALVWATICLVKGAEENSQRELRAYIGHMSERPGAHFEQGLLRDANGNFVVDRNGDVVRGEYGRVKYFDWNYGKTPAKDVRMYVRIVRDFIPAVLYDVLTAADEQQVVQIVHPNQNIGRIVGSLTIFDNFFLYGYVEYTDIFEHRWRHRFAFSHCYEAGIGGGERWEAHKSHNDEQKWDKKSSSWKPS